jgi:hypothetical protein
MAFQVAVVIFLSLGTIPDLKIEFILKKKEMSQSNNHLSMINLLLFLGVALPQVSGYTFPECNYYSTDCCWVVRSWQRFGKNASFSTDAPKACCTSIPGVTCGSEGRVTGIKWEGLQGVIPSALAKLKKLQSL